jgi:solute carrier family 6 amino acid/orphan transporter-like 15/16/17/18/20
VLFPPTLLQSILPWAECPVNSNLTGPVEECERATPTQYFFYRETLDISGSIEENGGIHMGQALCLLLAWIIVYLFIVKGVKSTGKVRGQRSAWERWTGSRQL